MDMPLILTGNVPKDRDPHDDFTVDRLKEDAGKRDPKLGEPAPLVTHCCYVPEGVPAPIVLLRITRASFRVSIYSQQKSLLKELS